MTLNGAMFPASAGRRTVVPCLERAARLFTTERSLELERWIEYTFALANWCIRQANTSIVIGDLEGAARWSMVAARILTRRSDPLVSREIEEILLKIGATLPRYSWQRSEDSAPKRFLHVIEEPRPYGGHTAMAKRWIENDPDNHIHSVAILSTTASVPETIASAVAQSCGQLYTANRVSDRSISLLQRAAWLRKLAFTQADCVVLHTFGENAVVPIAFGVNGGPPVLLVNHAAHVFWLGASVADVVLNCRGSAYEKYWTVVHRGIPRCETLPIPLPLPRRASQFDPNKKRKAKSDLGLDPECIALLTVGDSFKYWPIPGLNFLETLHTILERCPEAVLIVVGVTENEDWRTLARNLNNRVNVVGKQFDLRKYHDAADLYIEGFPFGSTTAFLEAANEGIAGVLAPADCPPPFSTDGIAIDGVLPQPASLEMYVSEVVELIQNPAKRERRAAVLAESVERHHVGSGWQQHLIRVVTNRPVEHCVYPLGTPDPPPKELSLYWVSFCTTYSKHFIGGHTGDPLEWAFKLVLQFGLKPHLDSAFRQACLRAKPFRDQVGAPLPVYFIVSALSGWFPQNWTRYIFSKFVEVLRVNGRLRRALRSLRKQFF